MIASSCTHSAVLGRDAQDGIDDISIRHVEDFVMPTREVQEVNTVAMHVSIDLHCKNWACAASATSRATRSSRLDLQRENVTPGPQ